ncbi:hypothetical protein [Mucilaginibacter pedocola]|uniref:Uncharacterized protein n=1 Tax=Mucilaginibacter pedocola TaxID=1792845 RepID=A0A1S9PCI7_9SPHI|nr:hypothetical protein [Mucilaginibacter pedocola]OOQ58683.1 hypothetical protein BC343_08435 [Mucilaginibacter pedocola]
MDNILLKYSLLDNASKKEVDTLMDQLLAKQEEGNSRQAHSAYKKRILEVSIWTEDDVQAIGMS